MSASVLDLLRPVLDGDLHRWAGLPADLTFSQVEATLPRDSEWSGTAQLGRARREASFAWLRVPGRELAVRAWFDGEHRVALLDFESHGMNVEVAALADQFGEQPSAQDTWFGPLPMPRSEFVFPAHGLAVFTQAETDTPWHVALFASTTLQQYLDTLRLDLRVRRLPARRPGGAEQG